jgi:hypothetical protein
MKYVVTKISVRDFAKECHKHGWNDGEYLPFNMEGVFNFVRDRYNLDGEKVDGAHNPYRINTPDEEIDASVPERDFLRLLWPVFGEEARECSGDEVDLLMGQLEGGDD